MKNNDEIVITLPVIYFDGYARNTGVLFILSSCITGDQQSETQAPARNTNNNQVTHTRPVQYSAILYMFTLARGHLFGCICSRCAPELLTFLIYVFKMPNIFSAHHLIKRSMFTVETSQVQIVKNLTLLHHIFSCSCIITAYEGEFHSRFKGIRG